MNEHERFGRERVESILWAMDLLAVLYLCRWALKNDRRDPGEQ